MRLAVARKVGIGKAGDSHAHRKEKEGKAA